MQQPNRINLVLLLLLSLIMVPLQAAEKFIIEDIRVEGLKRVTPGTVFNYLPMRVGDTFDDTRSSEAVRALFQTGLFDDVLLERDGNILVFIIKERLAIGSITVNGNIAIKTEDLLGNLKQFGFAEGRVFIQAQLDQTEQELRRQYYSLGKYAVKINSTVTEIDNGRVAIEINISEGLAARIKKVNIVGNKIFPEDQLLDVFSLTTETLFSFYTNNDQYSKQKLAGDLEALRSHYLNNGYLGFNIDSTQVSITPDKKDIYITINISEGSQYTISEVKLAGELILPAEEVFQFISVNKGELFSRKEVTESSDRLTQRLGEEGYSFANVNAIPDINRKDKTVSITYFVDPSKRVYVRRINFSGNSKTRDEVLRREMRQQEGAWISTSQVERGKERLERTGYFNNVGVDTTPVPGSTDQVDVNYSVEEASGGQIGLGLGFSQGQGLILNASISQRNFLGSGKNVDFAFNNSDVNTRYQIGYFDPYYTDNGISRGFNTFYREVDANSANLARYRIKEYGGSVNFRFPISEHNTIGTEFSYTNTALDLLSNSSTQLRDFIDGNGDTYDLLQITSSFSYDTRNKGILPDAGVLARVSTEVSLPGFGNTLEFYKIDLRTQWFLQLYDDFILTLGGDFGYGDSYGDTTELPFFENFFAGGPRSIRGFKENTLGPRDSSNRAIGGDTRLIGNAELILPVPFLSSFKESARITGFLDAGNVYGSGESFDIGELKYSTGISAIWISPFGALSASIAIPINDESTDDVQHFQFTFGTSF